MSNNAGYHPVAKLLHWSTVLLVIAQFGFAFAMSDGSQQRLPDRAAVLHISTGIVILGVTLARLAWRIRVPPGVPNSGEGNWEQRCARAVHLLIYGLLVGLPLSGVFAAYLRGWGVGFLGLPILPATIPGAHEPAARLVASVHAWVAVILLSALGLHLLAVTYHLFIRADGVAGRLMPEFLNRRLQRRERAAASGRS